jgi:hypothetical protein
MMMPNLGTTEKHRCQQGTNIIESKFDAKSLNSTLSLRMLFINSGISKPANNQKPEKYSRFGKNTLSNNKTKPQN